MEQHEVNDRPIGQPVDRIADRAADDEAKRQGGQALLGAREPNPQQCHRAKLEREQHVLAEIAVLRKQAVADAGVPGEHQREERRQMHDPAVGKIEPEQQPQL